MNRIALAAAFSAAVALSAAGCATEKAVAKPAPSSSTTAKAAPAPAKEPNPAPEVAQAAPPEKGPVYFEYDSAIIDTSGGQRLKDIGAYLQKSPTSRVRIVGHADERGTSEYNLALGDARARAARDYLIKLGIEPGRIDFSSRGEEEPAVVGSTEEDFEKNRRDEVEVL